MVPERILMSKGGEKLESVIGRGEDEELPNFEAGAFEIEVNDRLRNGKRLVDEKFLNNYVQEGAIDRHTMRGLVNFIRLVLHQPTQYPTSEELSIGKIKFKAFDLGGHRLHAQFGRLLCQEVAKSFGDKNHRDTGPSLLISRGGEERRRHLFWSIPLSWKQDHFCLAGAKLEKENSLTRTPSKVSAMFSRAQDKCFACTKTVYLLEKAILNDSFLANLDE